MMHALLPDDFALQAREGLVKTWPVTSPSAQVEPLLKTWPSAARILDHPA